MPRSSFPQMLLQAALVLSLISIVDAPSVVADDVKSIELACTSECALDEVQSTLFGNDRFFVLIFGSESEPKRPKYTHTFACIVRTVGTQPDVRDRALEVYTISWLPETLEIHPLKFIPEKGRNLRLHETLNWALKTGQSISQWGPYEAHPIVFLHALQRIEQSNKGKIRYQCIDFPFRSRVADCIHAVSDIDPLNSRLRYLIIRFGKDASRHIAETFYRNAMFISPDLDYSWIHSRLGLDEFPIEVERLEDVQRNFPRKLARVQRATIPKLSSVPGPDIILSAEEEVDDSDVRPLEVPASHEPPKLP